ncbi:MAG: lectin mannose-binding 1 [Syntrophaceae bacterium]|nr:MAG: lectin mannose-binding 1 [Syntrophaceae bacterium]
MVTSDEQKNINVIFGIGIIIAIVVALLVLVFSFIVSAVAGVVTVGISFVLSPGIFITSFLSKIIETGMPLKWILSIAMSLILFIILKKIANERKVAIYLLICSILFIISAGIFFISPGSGYEKKVIRPTLAGMFRFVNFTPFAKFVVVWPGLKVFYNVSDNATFKSGKFWNTEPPEGIDAEYTENDAEVEQTASQPQQTEPQPQQTEPQPQQIEPQPQQTEPQPQQTEPQPQQTGPQSQQTEPQPLK